MFFRKGKRPSPGEVNPDRADPRCPKLECVWVKSPFGNNYIPFDCTNRHPEIFCKATMFPWSPSGNPDKPVPSLTAEERTVNSQIGMAVAHEGQSPL